MPPTPTVPPYGSPSLFDAFTPPVPPLPTQRSPVGSPIADVFAAFPMTSKPLPPIIVGPRMRESDDPDERSMIFVDNAASPDTIRNKPLESPTTSKALKRRSMSVGDAEVKKVMRALSLDSPLPPTPERKDDAPLRLNDSALNGILDEFKGELSQLDPVQGSSLDLRDPSTPARRAAFRSKTDGLTLSLRTQDSPEIQKSASLPSPTSPVLTLQIPSHSLADSPKKEKQPSPIVPPRSSSLQMPRVAARPISIGSPRGTLSKHPTSPLRSRTGPASHLPSPNPQDTARLRTLHRSTASSSEPSLIPSGNDGHVCKYMYSSYDPIVHSPFTPLQTLTVPSPRTNSQQDLSANELTLTRPSPTTHSSITHSPIVLSPAVGDDSAEMDARAKELANRCWAEDEDFLAKEKIAEWLGGQ